MLERFLTTKKDLYVTFVDVDKAVGGEMGAETGWGEVEKWNIRLVMSMCENAKSAVDINSTTGEEIRAEVGVNQGSALSPLLLIIVLEAPTREYRSELPWELLYSDDLLLMVE